MAERDFPSFLMADDDEEDCLLASSAFNEAGIRGEMRLVEDGNELMEYLHRQGAFADRERDPQAPISSWTSFK